MRPPPVSRRSVSMTSATPMPPCSLITASISKRSRAASVTPTCRSPGPPMPTSTPARRSARSPSWTPSRSRPRTPRDFRCFFGVIHPMCHLQKRRNHCVFNGSGVFISLTRMMKINNRFCPFFSFLISLPLNASHFLSLHCSNFNFLLPRFSNLQNSRCSFGAQKAPAVSCRGCFCVTPRCTRSTRAPCPARRPCPRATPWRDRGRGPSRCSRGP